LGIGIFAVLVCEQLQASLDIHIHIAISHRASIVLHAFFETRPSSKRAEGEGRGEEEERRRGEEGKGREGAGGSGTGVTGRNTGRNPKFPVPKVKFPQYYWTSP
jgi:hypothetical protein